MKSIDYAVVWLADKAGWLSLVDGRIVSAFLITSSSTNARRIVRWALALGVLILLAGMLYHLRHKGPAPVPSPVSPPPISVPIPAHNQESVVVPKPARGSGLNNEQRQQGPTRDTEMPTVAKDNIRTLPGTPRDANSPRVTSSSSDSELSFQLHVEAFAQSTDKSAGQELKPLLDSYEKGLGSSIKRRFSLDELERELRETGVKPGTWTAEFEVEEDGSVDPNSFKPTHDSVVPSIVKQAILNGEHFPLAPKGLQLLQTKVELRFDWKIND
jgi:hypothetical protein